MSLSNDHVQHIPQAVASLLLFQLLIPPSFVPLEHCFQNLPNLILHLAGLYLFLSPPFTLFLIQTR